MKSSPIAWATHVEPRKEFIYKNALYASNLDV
jgi:hypothetical protein